MPKIWRIAVTVALIVCAGIAVLIGYEVFVRGNELVMDNLSTSPMNPVLAFVLTEALFATFLIGLITFPYYWFAWASFWLRGRSETSAGALARGTALSASCGLIALWLALIVLDLDGPS